MTTCLRGHGTGFSLHLATLSHRQSWCRCVCPCCVDRSRGAREDQRSEASLSSVGGFKNRRDISKAWQCHLQPFHGCAALRYVCDAVGLRCVFQAAFSFPGLSAQLCRRNGLLRGCLFLFWLSSVISIILQCCSIF